MTAIRFLILLLVEAAAGWLVLRTIGTRLLLLTRAGYLAGAVLAALIACGWRRALLVLAASIITAGTFRLGTVLATWERTP